MMLGFIIFVVLFLLYTDKEDFWDIFVTIVIAEVIAEVIPIILGIIF